MRITLYTAAAAVMLFSAVASAFTIKAGDKLPSADLHFGFPPTFVNTAEYLANRNVIVVPGYLEAEDALKEAGVDEVLVYCVNDAAVMKGWALDQRIEGSIVTMMGDPHCEFTKACGMEMTHPGPPTVGIIGRCKRWAMYVEKNIVKHVAVAEAEDDPAGDDNPTATLAPALLEAVKALTSSTVA